MKIDFYGLKAREGQRVNVFAGLPAARCTVTAEPDLDRELPAAEAVEKAEAGEPVLIKLWLRTEGRPDLHELERRLAEILAPLGLR